MSRSTHSPREPGSGPSQAPTTAKLAIDLEAPSLARRVVTQAASNHPRLSDAVLATSEVVTNAVRHADASEATLLVRLYGGVLRVQVEHEGKGFLPRTPTDSLGPSGRGFAILQAVADRWGVEGGSTTVVWFEINDPSAEV